MPRSTSEVVIQSVNLSVTDLFESMSEAERAIFFNKLLKYEGYSPRSVSLERAEELVTKVKQARGI